LSPKATCNPIKTWVRHCLTFFKKNDVVLTFLKINLEMITITYATTIQKRMREKEEK
jgi:hypothetical protein